MEITFQDQGEVKIIRLDGMIDGVTVTSVETSLKGHLSEGVTKMLLNLESLSYINSIGLRVILMVAKQLKNNEGELRICSLTDPVREVFDITGFSSILNVHPSEEEALQGF